MSERLNTPRTDPLIGSLFFRTLVVMIVAELSSSLATLPDDSAPEHNIGLRIMSRIAKNMDYVSIFNLNQFMIEL